MNLRKTISNIATQGIENPQLTRRFLNAWAPLFGSGIRITHVADDWSTARIELKLRPWTQNMHGAAFGGSLFAMTDVMFGTMVMGRMGRDYEAWTRTGEFQYISPGRNGAYLEVEFSDTMLEWVRNTVAEDGYCNVPYTSIVKNKDGSVVGIGQQDLHVRPRKNATRVAAPKHAREPRGLVLESLATAVVWHCFRDQPEILTILMSEQRRIPSPEKQMEHVINAALEKSTKSRDDLLALGIPEAYLQKFER
ncbi:DUF4442 domain-containing protein [Corynebacterium sp. 320]|uniref:PaaI family thioesterase n=1 Tax=Corynebacterium TaxID=1716 RepID=UPI00125CB1D9|nr:MULTISPECIES: DUF4442 domain-containing protein [Corynebacterium]KAB1502730.1 DUF4442 domain-containing protein [Corynebacterium sp. 320]KAB1550532.1 DUF4442 domain-containing protein [Corynebacterium sp. 319]KAB1554740.1 DUF4442 domain-containing protein [Corynebacterium sp. 321]KAB3526393.1 DUF4442 domain-containing protein [Corynebacterium sp. 250]KAB3537762.1 DUF4442 domain-containing protein [Corynebacterium sp. 366]